MPENEWSARTAIPAGTFSPAVGVHAATGIVHYGGGYNSSKSAQTSQRHYDPALDAWSTSFSFGSNIGPAWFEDGGFTYYMASHTTMLARVDEATSSASTMAVPPHRHAHGAYGKIGGFFYAAFGSDTNDISGTLTSSLHRYDIAGNSWSARSSGATPRFHPAFAVAEGKLYAFGGESSVGEPGTLIGSVEVYDPDLDAWS